jgi:ferredoxin-type protein NapH
MSLPLSVKRSLVQVLAAIALTTNVSGISMGNACIPILYCEACSLSWLGCPVGIMSAAIAFHEIPWLVLAIVFGSALVVGRWFCGWICPSGLIQDWLYKIPGRKIGIPRWTRFIKYAVLVGPVIIIAYYFTRESLYSFCSWCPTATASVVIPQALQFQSLEWGWDVLRLGILALVLVMAVLNHRSFCKVLCPIGAMVSLFSRFSWLAIRLDAKRCGGCRKCDRECPMDVDVTARKDSGKRVNSDPECINCLSCEDACARTAISNNSGILKK